MLNINHFEVHSFLLPKKQIKKIVQQKYLTEKLVKYNKTFVYCEIVHPSTESLQNFIIFHYTSHQKLNFAILLQI